MLALPILVGIVAFFAFAQIVGGFDHSPGAGILPGIVAAIWAAWPIWHFHSAARNRLLHPQPKLHAVNAQVAFNKIRDVLREKFYQYGDKWHVITSDVATMRIVADLRYFDEESHIEMGHRGDLQNRTVRVQRYLRLEMQMHGQGSATVVQFDFEPRIEGLNLTACDSIIRDFMTSAESAIGAGETIEAEARTKLPAPPLWLSLVTACSISLLLVDVLKDLFK